MPMTIISAPPIFMSIFEYFISGLMFPIKNAMSKKGMAKPKEYAVIIMNALPKSGF